MLIYSSGHGQGVPATERLPSNVRTKFHWTKGYICKSSASMAAACGDQLTWLNWKSKVTCHRGLCLDTRRRHPWPERRRMLWSFKSNEKQVSTYIRCLSSSFSLDLASSLVAFIFLLLSSAKGLPGVQLKVQEQMLPTNRCNLLSFTVHKLIICSHVR